MLHTTGCTGRDQNRDQRQRLTRGLRRLCCFSLHHHKAILLHIHKAFSSAPLGFRVKVNCRLLCYLFLGLWAELVAGGTLPINAGLRSIAEDLLKALESYGGKLKSTEVLKDLHPMKCNEPPVPWSKTSMVAYRLLQKQTCVEEHQPSPQVDIYSLMILNQDLLQHLRPGQEITKHLSSSTSRPLTPSPTRAPDYNMLIRFMLCFDCWIQQVEALLT